MVTADLLSQGRKQLLSLGRTILTRQACTACGEGHGVGGILLLDQVTSNLDAATDMRIQQVIQEEFLTYTIISVAHRLDTILDSRGIAVIRLIEFDSVPGLLPRDSAFSMLYEARSSGYLEEFRILSA